MVPKKWSQLSNYKLINKFLKNNKDLISFLLENDNEVKLEVLNHLLFEDILIKVFSINTNLYLIFLNWNASNANYLSKKLFTFSRIKYSTRGMILACLFFLEVEGCHMISNFLCNLDYFVLMINQVPPPIGTYKINKYGVNSKRNGF